MAVQHTGAEARENAKKKEEAVKNTFFFIFFLGVSLSPNRNKNKSRSNSKKKNDDSLECRIAV